MQIYTPITILSLYRTMNAAFLCGKPAAIRYPNGRQSQAVVERFGEPKTSDADFLLTDFDSSDTLDAVIITHGRIVTEAMRAKDLLSSDGVRAGIVLLEQIKPYETVAGRVAKYLPKKSCPILFLEEEIRAGGMGMLLSDALRNFDVMQNKTSEILALRDAFLTPKAGQTMYEAAGLDAGSIAETIRKMLRK